MAVLSKIGVHVKFCLSCWCEVSNFLNQCSKLVTVHYSSHSYPILVLVFFFFEGGKSMSALAVVSSLASGGHSC